MGHALPHAPQFIALRWVSTHAPMQSVCPAAHATTQRPIEQL